VERKNHLGRRITGMYIWLRRQASLPARQRPQAIDLDHLALAVGIDDVWQSSCLAGPQLEDPKFQKKKETLCSNE